MEWLQYVFAGLFVVLGGVCVVLVVVQLPGTWLLLGLAAAIEYVDRLYLPENDQQTFDWWVLGGCLALAVIGEIIEFVAGAAGARKGGSSTRGMVGALIGGVVGIFLFASLFSIVPLFGTIFGAFLGSILGTFAGAIIGELTAEQSTIKGSMKPALGATIGRILGTIGKIGIAMAMWLALAVDAFF